MYYDCIIVYHTGCLEGHVHLVVIHVLHMYQSVLSMYHVMSRKGESKPANGALIRVSEVY